MRIGSISGSLQRLVNDTSYLVAGTNVTIASGSNGQVTISSTGGGGGGGGYELAFNSTNLAGGILSVTHGLPDDYVHVSVYNDLDYQIIPNEVIITGIGTLDIDLSSYAVPASPDWHVFVTSANASLGGSPGSPDTSVQFNDGGSFGGDANFTYDKNNDILFLTGTLLQQGGGTNLVGFMGDSPVPLPNDIGADVFFFVSGSSGSIGTTDRGVAAFGGDVVISGSLKIGTGSITLTSNDLQFGDFGTRVERSGNDMKFYDVNVPAGATLSSLIGGGSGSPSLPFNSVQYNNAGSFAGSAALTFDGKLRLSSSFEHGSDSSAAAAYTHAEGLNSLASNTGAHAEGYLTTGSGYASHAEGQQTEAAGQGSHSEGYLSVAQSSHSHAEGKGTTSNAGYSHAEGENTYTGGVASHAEGYFTTASAPFSHAEGYLSYVGPNSWYAHAEGRETRVDANATAAHVEGHGTIASGSYQHVQGKYNLRNNDFSLFVIGNGTGDADGNRSDIIRVNASDFQVTGSVIQRNIGSTTTVGFMGADAGLAASVGTDVFFFVSGSSGSMGTTVRGVAAFGGDVIVSGALKIGTGSITLTSNDIQFSTPAFKIEKSGNSLKFYDFDVPSGVTLSELSDNEPAAPTNSVQYNAGGGSFGGSSNFTYDGRVYLTGSLEQGSGPIALGDYSHAEGGTYLGKIAIPFGEIFTLVNKTYLGVSSGTFSHVEGVGCLAIGSGSHAEGFLTIASGNYSHAEGGPFTQFDGGVEYVSEQSIAYGVYSHVEGIGTVAHGSGSHAEGRRSYAAGDYSHAEGNLSYANGVGSHSEGVGGQANGDYSHAEGNGCVAIGESSHAEGYTTVASGSYSHASGYYTIASGSAQTVVGKYNMRSNDHSLFVVGNGSGDDSTSRSDAFRIEPGVASDSRVEVSGSVIVTKHYAGDAQTLDTGDTVVDPNVHMTLFDASGGNITATLGDGSHVGQIKLMVMIDTAGGATSNTAAITVTTTLGIWTTLTFGEINHTATLVWTGAPGWSILNAYGTSVS